MRTNGSSGDRPVRTLHEYRCGFGNRRGKPDLEDGLLVVSEILNRSAERLGVCGRNRRAEPDAAAQEGTTASMQLAIEEIGLDVIRHTGTVVDDSH